MTLRKNTYSFYLPLFQSGLPPLLVVFPSTFDTQKASQRLQRSHAISLTSQHVIAEASVCLQRSCAILKQLISVYSSLILCFRIQVKLQKGRGIEGSSYTRALAPGGVQRSVCLINDTRQSGSLITDLAQVNGSGNRRQFILIRFISQY